MEQVAIVYDVGAATPLEILTSLADLVEPVFVLPESDHNRQVADMLADLAVVASPDDLADFGPRGIMTFSDFQLETTAELAAGLGLPFHTTAVAHDLTRKYSQRTILNEHGVDHIATALVVDRESAERAAEIVPLPGVLKPNRGFGGTHTYPIDSPAELFDVVAKSIEPQGCAPDDGFVLETRLFGDRVEPPWGSYVSVESVVRGGLVHHLGITGKLALSPPFREQGSYLPARLPDSAQDAALDLTARALTALGVGDSICHTELMLTAGGPRIIEVNGRLGHPIHDLFHRGHGIDLIQLAAEIALGRDLSTKVGPCDGVVYHYFGLPPMEARRLVELPGLATARALPEVDQLELLMPTQSAVDWRRGFQERIYTCRGTVRTHDELAAFVQNIDQVLAPRYE
ncbi:hypothetical protein AB0I53_16815 [Saccharopolyspora sp. NPDC050389]|uniref:ATP-grasp domain-containing protein n=1 Tax=Saccharopolyspora sp. NPDC050389 TaxID=3155516 RepID=UPI0033CA4AF5